MIYKGYDRTLSPGTYTIPNDSTPIQMVDLISDNRNRDFQFTIFAGWRMEEIAALVDQLGFDLQASNSLSKPGILLLIYLPRSPCLKVKSGKQKS